MERSTIFNGKIHYFYGHFQLQTVSSPEGIFPMGNHYWGIYRDYCFHFFGFLKQIQEHGKITINHGWKSEFNNHKWGNIRPKFAHGENWGLFKQWFGTPHSMPFPWLIIISPLRLPYMEFSVSWETPLQCVTVSWIIVTGHRTIDDHRHRWLNKTHSATIDYLCVTFSHKLEIIMKHHGP